MDLDERRPCVVVSSVDVLSRCLAEPCRARHERHLSQLRGLLARATLLPTTPADYDSAAALYRTCRSNGTTVRKLIDCLIGAVAIAADAEVLHDDADFSGLASHTSLRVHSAAPR